MARCRYCRQTYKGDDALRRHQAHAPACRRQRDAWLAALWDQRRLREKTADGASTAAAMGAVNDMPLPQDGFSGLPGNSTLSNPLARGCPPGDTELDHPDQDATAPTHCTHVEDIPDEDLYPKAHFAELLPGAIQAGAPIGEARLPFQQIRDEQVLRGYEIYGPFESEEKWELVKWLIKNVGHMQTESFLKLPIIKDCVQPSFRNKDSLLDLVDTLPGGVTWECEQISLMGDIHDVDGESMNELVELWFRNPLNVTLLMKRERCEWLMRCGRPIGGGRCRECLV